MLDLTATEAAAISVVLTILIGFLERSLTLRSMWTAIRESLVQTSAIFLIAACAKIFVSFVALTGAAGAVASFVADAGLPPARPARRVRPPPSRPRPPSRRRPRSTISW